jgi:C4-dicarboxylate transporter, DctM subunit
VSYEANADLEAAPVQGRPSSPLGYLIDGLNAVGSVVIAAVMVLMCADVLLRNIANQPIDGVAELVATSIVVIVFLQLPATLRQGRMSRADLFIDPLVQRRPAAGKALRALFSLVGVFACAVIAYATWPVLARAWSDAEFWGIEGVFTFPTWPMRAVVILGAGLASLQYLLLAWQVSRKPAMSDLAVGLTACVALLAFIYFGMHIGVALIVTSFVSVLAIKSGPVAAKFVAASANDAIRDYLFGVVPLFVLMGMFVSVSGVGRDTFDVFQWLLRRIRGGLGLATVASNAVFAAITGISIASASVFTKVAVPEMIRMGYTPRFSVGVVAGSSVLGMLIPPSLLMIVYGVLAEESIGRMFIAGLIPGIVLALGFAVLIVGMAYFTPSKVGTDAALIDVPSTETLGSAGLKIVPIALLIALVLGGLYGGLFTPTEAGAVGAAGAFVIALVRKRLTWRKLWNVLVETGYVSVSVLFLILAASLYSRMLALTGMPSAVTEAIGTLGLGPWGFMAAYLLIVIALGCIIDSVSIMLIMLPIVLPVARAFGMDIVWFGVITVVAVEIGLLTPPFGVSVYTVKAALNDPNITIRDIFAGSFPFVLAMVAVLLLLLAFPSLSTVLARSA